MKQIYYVIQALIHGRSSNIIKVVSLGLGLTMSILLFSRVVYEQSFDTCFKDHDKLYQLWNIWTVNGEPLPPSEYIIGAAAGGILDAMPEIVESAASAGIWPVSSPVYNGSVRFDDFKVAQNLKWKISTCENLCQGNTCSKPDQSIIKREVLLP